MTRSAVAAAASKKQPAPKKGRDKESADRAIANEFVALAQPVEPTTKPTRKRTTTPLAEDANVRTETKDQSERAIDLTDGADAVNNGGKSADKRSKATNRAEKKRSAAVATSAAIASAVGSETKSPPQPSNGRGRPSDYGGGGNRPPKGKKRAKTGGASAVAIAPPASQ